MVNLNNLFLLIQEKGNAKKVSDETGISSGNISDWKKGRSMPTAVKLDLLADYFEVSVDYLLGRTDNPNITSTTISNSNVNSGNISGDNIQGINADMSISKRDRQLLEQINNLDFQDYCKVISYISELTKNK